MRADFEPFLRIEDVDGCVLPQVCWQRTERELDFEIARQRLDPVSTLDGMLVLGGLLLIGKVDEAERALRDVDAAVLPPAPRTAHELVVAGIAIRRLRTKAARAALERAEHFAREARISALTAEVENARALLEKPAARLVAKGEERLLRLEDLGARVGRRDAVGRTESRTEDPSDRSGNRRDPAHHRLEPLCHGRNLG